MTLDAPPDATPYRVTLFFGPEPVDGDPTTQTCVFNVKKRSWKAGSQVSASTSGQTSLWHFKKPCDRRLRSPEPLNSYPEEDRTDAATRIPDLAAQAIAWCKLDLRLAIGLPQENQRIPGDEFVAELNQVIPTRQEYVVTYILTELDLMP